MELQKVKVGLAVIARKFFDFAYVEQMLPGMQRALETEYSTPVHGGLIFTAQEAEQAVKLFKEQGCGAVVMAFGTFADAAPAVTIATGIDVPMILWSPAEPASETGRLRLNSLCGANLAGNALVSLNRPFKFVYGSENDERTVQKLRSRLKVAAIAKALRETKIALFGTRPDGYYAVNFDEMELRRVVGTAVDYFSLAELQARARQADPAEKAAFVDTMRSRAAGMEKLDSKQVEGTAGTYAAIKALAKERGYGAVAVKCWPEFFADYNHAACGAMGCLTDDGIMGGCESDVNGAVMMMAQHLLTGEATFIADLVAIDEEKNGWILWHCGGQPASLANPNQEITAAFHPNRKIALALWFGAKPGPVTIARLSYQRGRYRMLVMKGEALDEKPMYSHGISAKVKLQANAVDAATKLIEEGFEHHLIMCYGDVSAELTALAELWGIELVRI